MNIFHEPNSIHSKIRILHNNIILFVFLIYIYIYIYNFISTRVELLILDSNTIEILGYGRCI